MYLLIFLKKKEFKFIILMHHSMTNIANCYQFFYFNNIVINICQSYLLKI